MTGPDQQADQQSDNGVPEVAGMPSMNPPKGGPNADPDAIDPAALVAPRPGAVNSEGDEADVDGATGS